MRGSGMGFSQQALARIGKAIDPAFDRHDLDREMLVAIAMGFSIPTEDGSFRRPSPEAQALAAEMLSNPGVPSSRVGS